ncbi:MAG: phosphorylase [Methylococcales bacterium]|nr:phosphorylase [Methylococcales bacterium]
MTIGIIAALPEECRTLTTRAVNRQQPAWMAAGVCLLYSGVGSNQAESAALRLLELGAEVIVSWGCAAGLAVDARPGQLLLTDTVIGSAGALVSVDSALLHAWRSQLSDLALIDGRLYSADQLITQSAEKRRLHQATSANVLDMESFAIAQVADAAAKPFIIVRAIADPWDMDLPGVVAGGMAPSGEVNAARVALGALAKPWQIPSLIRLARHFKQAQTVLTQAATALALSD